jgi:hypothetical protein
VVQFLFCISLGDLHLFWGVSCLYCLVFCVWHFFFFLSGVRPPFFLCAIFVVCFLCAFTSCLYCFLFVVCLVVLGRWPCLYCLRLLVLSFRCLSLFFFHSLLSLLSRSFDPVSFAGFFLSLFLSLLSLVLLLSLCQLMGYFPAPFYLCCISLVCSSLSLFFHFFAFLAFLGLFRFKLPFGCFLSFSLLFSMLFVFVVLLESH